jgi:WD40 repeat protein
VIVWDDKLSIRAAWKAHDGQAYSLAFMADGRLATCGEDKSVRFWDIESQREISRGSDHKNAVYGVTLLSNGRLASAGQDRVIRIWTTSAEGSPRRAIER